MNFRPNRDEKRGEDFVPNIGEWLDGWLELPSLIRRIMATLEEVQAQVTAAGEATNNIAADVQRLKDQIDSILAGEQGRIDAAVQAALQQVSDQMTPLVTQLQGVASETPES